MISRVRGTLLRSRPEVAEVMTPGGVAYEISIPLTVYERLPREGQEVELRTVQVVREDAVELFGFLDDRERAVFGRLLTASGIGPRLALAMLSTLSPDRLVRAIAERDTSALRQVPGVGAKKAERIVVELQGKLDDLALAATGPVPQSRAADEATSALIALGYTPAQAVTAVRRALEKDGRLKGTDLIKAALAVLSK